MPAPAIPLRPRILALIAEVFGCRPDLACETTLESLQVHPMRRMELVCEAEDLFGLSLEISAFDSAKTVGDLVAPLEAALAAQNPLAA